MKRRLILCAVLIGVVASPGWAETYCGVEDPPTEIQAAVKAAMAGRMPKALAKNVVIPVSLNIITSGRQGNYSNAVIDVLMHNLNYGFRDTPFRFRLAKFRRVNNKKWFRNCTFGTASHTAMTKKLALDPRSYVNIYVCRMGDPGLLGLGSFPWFPFGPTDKRQSVVLSPDVLPHGLSDPRWSTYGLTVVHEVGHYLGLYHTFHEGCAGGDQVADTPPQAEPTGFCPSFLDTCPEPGADDVSNFMNYAEDVCQDHFTPGQIDRMIVATEVFRPLLIR